MDSSGDEGCVTFEVCIPAFDFDEYNIATPKDGIARIAFKRTAGSSYEISVCTRGEYNELRAAEEARACVGLLLTRICVTLDATFYNLHLRGYKIPIAPSERKGSARYRVMSQVSLSGGAVVRPNMVEARELDRLIPTLTGAPNKYDSAWALYSFASRQGDALAAFMMLYNIMMQIGNDSQPKIDRLIRETDPSVHMTPDPRGIPIYESVYTKIRNEIAHNRSRIPSQSLIDEVARVLPSFKSIVRKILLGLR